MAATAGAIEAMERIDGIELEPLVSRFLFRHLLGDWGDVDAEDKAANDRAAADGQRVLSEFRLPDAEGTRIWVVTEANRALTTFLLPREY